ncbi:MAG: hypothetical protein K0S56_1502 [Microvirga sp.]|nr:hypothetical protein [Microvirga sp.]
MGKGAEGERISHGELGGGAEELPERNLSALYQTGSSALSCLFLHPDYSLCHQTKAIDAPPRAKGAEVDRA